MTPRLTVAFVPRERFSLAAKSLESVLQGVDVPYNLIIVNPNYPEQYWSETQEVLDRLKPNLLRDLQVFTVDHYILPNASKNIVLDNLKTELVLMIENDNFVTPGFASLASRALDEEEADVLIPVLVEGKPGSKKVHFDTRLGSVIEKETAAGKEMSILPRKGLDRLDGKGGRTRVEFMEQHCLLFRTEIFKRIGHYDERLNTRDEIDLSLNLRRAGARVIRENAWIVNYIPPFPPNRDDLDYFLFKWDLEQAAKSHEIITKKWSIVAFPGSLEFVKYRRTVGRLLDFRAMIQTHVDFRSRFLLIDGGWLSGGHELIRGLSAVPFVEREGKFYGHPLDDDDAINELKKIEADGICTVIIMWYLDWYRSTYPRFWKYLYDHYGMSASSECVTILRRYDSVFKAPRLVLTMPT